VEGKSIDEVMDEWDEVSQRISFAISQARDLLSPGEEDRFIVTVNARTANNQPVTIYVNIADHQMLSGDYVLSKLLAALNSYDTLQSAMQLVFGVRPRSVPRAVGNMLEFRGDYSVFVKSKRSVVQCMLKDHCFWEAVALGLALKVKDHQRSFEDWDDTLYDKMIKHRDKMDIRLKAVQTLMRITGFNHGLVRNADEIRQVEDKLNIQVIVMDFFHQLVPVYPEHRQSLHRDRIFMLTTCSKGEWSHVDFVKDVVCLQSNRTSRFCYQCFSFYSRQKHCSSSDCSKKVSETCHFCHCCADVCRSCHRSDCVDNDNGSWCPLCEVPHHNERCAEMHEQFCTVKHERKCPVCDQKEHKGIACFHYKCRTCGEEVDKRSSQVHRCFLQRESLKKPMTKYVVYDFECSLNEAKEHVPYLATATLPFEEEESDVVATLREAFPTCVFHGFQKPTVFVFWGLQGVYGFFEFIRHTALKKFHFLAHNARAYDHIVIKKVMMQKYRLYSVDIKRGQKYLQMAYPSLKIVFKDSLSFIPSTLRSMSKDFGIHELAKGYFPHELVTVQYLEQAQKENYVVDMPDRSYFEVEGTDEEIRSMNEWLDEWYASNVKWKLKEEAIQYCVSDTVLLAEAIKNFRHQCLCITDKLTRPADLEEDKYVSLDPFQFVTLPSAIMSFYLSQMLPEQKIAVLDRYPCLQSQVEHEYLCFIEFDKDVVLRRQQTILGATVDGYDEDSQTVYQFHGCYWHGCPRCFQGSLKNTRSKCTFEDLYHQTCLRTELLRSHGYQVVEKWECDWTYDKGHKEEVKTFFEQYGDEIEELKPLDPRDAYKGGKSEVYKFRVDSEICMVDFVSQYPTVMLGTSTDPYTQENISWELPVGHPIIIHNPVQYELVSGVLGIAKVRVLPPKQLYAPFLSYQVPSRLGSSYEVLYGLCKQCMLNRNRHSCTHSEWDRSFVGTWTLSELEYAQSIGYTVTKWFEVWEYHDKSATLFRDFIVPFMCTKIQSKAKGLVENGVFTEQGVQVSNYIFELTGERVCEQDFEDNPARRTVAKLIQNAFTGKWGQKEEYSNSACFYTKDMKACQRILNDGNIEITYLEVIPLSEEEEMICMNYVPKSGSSTTYTRKNDHIVAHITAYGRMMLNRLENQLGETLIYCDTDSAYHCRHENPPYETGFRTGDLELELASGSSWRALGRKSYSYLKQDKSLVSRQKGVSLKASALQRFGVDVMKSLIESTKRMMDEHLESFQADKKRLIEQAHESYNAEITVPQRLFVTCVNEHKEPYKKTELRDKRIRFNLFAAKRSIQWNQGSVIDSLPFGYVQD
jgi:G:T-mismatch repair DNA endonuclease (very short patch repair protein)